MVDLPATGKTLRSRVGLDLGGVGGGGMPPPVTLVAPAELSWAYGIARHPLNPFSSVPVVSESGAVWAGWSRSPRQTLRHGAVVVALAPLASLIVGPVVKEEPAASSTS